MPPKIFKSDRVKPILKPLELPPTLTGTHTQNIPHAHPLQVRSALDRVLRLISVGSKLFLTNKVDRSVTGLIAQQQCVGPLQLPLSNVSVIAQSHFGLTGGVTAIGEQPIKGNELPLFRRLKSHIGLINHAAMARMSVGEMLTNIVWAQISRLEDIKCSGNWMWAAKLPGEGAAMYDTAIAMRDIMLSLGIFHSHFFLTYRNFNRWRKRQSFNGSQSQRRNCQVTRHIGN
jgi:phosphoribosylformylglycinamidine synthase